MLKRSIIISSPCRVSLSNRQLVCTNLDDDSKRNTAPIEDLGIVIAENQRIVFTIPLLNALADNNTIVVLCDGRMMPNSVITGLNVNSTQSEVLRAQASMIDSPTNKRIWKQIIEAKIKNQSLLLDKLGMDGAILKPMYSNVVSGDADNREGAAAKIYWRTIFSDNFTRDREGGAPNNMLNYGYSILRSAVARALIGSGLNLSFGVFHRNRYNSMPLADDVMEPFRPFVDEIVYELYNNGETELTTEVKSHLINVLSCDTQYGDIQRPLLVGLSLTTASLVKCYFSKERKLVLPKLE